MTTATDGLCDWEEIFDALPNDDSIEFDEDECIQLAFLRDEEVDALITAGLLSSELRLSSPLDSTVVFSFDQVILSTTTRAHYPADTVDFHLENLDLSREKIDSLRRQLKWIIETAEKTNNVHNWRNRENANAHGIFEPKKVVLWLAQAVSLFLRKLRSPGDGSLSKHASTKPGSDKHLWVLGSGAKQAVAPSTFLTSSTRGLAHKLLGLSPQQIAATIPSSFRVLHVEQVLRADLGQSLQQYQDRLRQTLSKVPLHLLHQFVPSHLRSHRIDDMVDHLVQPRLTYHGTQRHLVASIVRHGFVPPGQFNPTSGKPLDVRCGSTYGRGIYSSPSAAFSLSYSGTMCQRTGPGDFFGLKLIVCATVMGRTRDIYRDDNWRQQERPYEGCDSHIGNDGQEFIVFQAAQIVPIYVVHLDWGADNAEYFYDLPDDPARWLRSAIRQRLSKTRSETMTPGDRQRAKEAVYARASKWFPYGYGPATGTKFLVEEIGEVSEDEEDYGEYQAQRIDERDDGVKNTDFWSWFKAAEEEKAVLTDGAHDADVYGCERKATAIPKGFGKKAVIWDSLPAPNSEKSPQQVEDDDFFIRLLMYGEDD